MLPIKPIPRRAFLAGVALLPLATACGARSTQRTTNGAASGAQDGPQIVVYKSPT